MARFKMEDGTVLDTTKATMKFEERTRWNGQNHISLATGDQWVHETLYRSAKGRWYVVTSSQWQCSTDTAEFMEPRDASRWLLTNDYGEKEIPEELHAHLYDLSE